MSKSYCCLVITMVKYVLCCRSINSWIKKTCHIHKPKPLGEWYEWVMVCFDVGTQNCLHSNKKLSMWSSHYFPSKLLCFFVIPHDDTIYVIAHWTKPSNPWHVKWMIQCASDQECFYKLYFCNQLSGLPLVECKSHKKFWWQTNPFHLSPNILSLPFLHF